MKITIEELMRVVDDFGGRLSAIPDAEFADKPLPNKWSKKEVLGHLIDSGQNNLRRFICGQYESAPPKIVYDQDFWVASNGYQNMMKDDVISLWKLVNRQIGSILKNMPEKNYSRECDTGNEKVNLHSLQWLAEDYVRHMKHHLNQIIPGSFDVVYN